MYAIGLREFLLCSWWMYRSRAAVTRGASRRSQEARAASKPTRMGGGRRVGMLATDVQMRHAGTRVHPRPKEFCLTHLGV